MGRIAFAMVVLAALPGAVAAAPEGGPVFWVGAAAPCNFNSLPTAIAAVPSGAEIRIANNQAYDNLNIDINDKDLTLSGGWSDCIGTVSDQRAVLNGGVANQPVVRVRSAVTPRLVILRQLEIRGGLRSGIELRERVELRVERSVVDGNEAIYGGGVRVIGDGTVQTVLRVMETRIGGAGDPGSPGNTANFDGGGIHCHNAQVQLRAAVIRNNHVNGHGGGLYADACRVFTGTHLYSFPGIGVVTLLIEGNHAEQFGGGIRALGGSSLTLAPGTSSIFAVRGNSAGFDGGGFALTGAGTQLVGVGLSLIGNQTNSRGGAGYVAAGANATLHRPDPALPDAATNAVAPAGIGVLGTRCALPEVCNEVRGNQAQTAGAFYVDAGGLTLGQTVLEGNVASIGSQIRLFSGSSSRIEHSLIHGNDSGGGDLLRAASGSSLVLNSVTVADNATGAVLIQALSGGGNNINVRNSIIWQPGTTVLAATAADTVAAVCLNAHEAASLPALTHEPGFIASDAGDYRLFAGSANVDACGDPVVGVASIDILGLPRPVDLATGAGSGLFDRGAYELGDRIFADAFDDVPKE